MVIPICAQRRILTIFVVRGENMLFALSFVFAVKGGGTSCCQNLIDTSSHKNLHVALNAHSRMCCI